MASASSRIVRRTVPALVGASASGLFITSESEGPTQLIVPGSSIHELRNMMLAMPVENSIKETILDLGIDMASDPRIQSIVAEKYGFCHRLKCQVDINDELEDQRELNKQLLLQNDRLMNEIDNLKHELRQNVTPSEDVQPQPARQQPQQVRMQEEHTPIGPPRNPFDNYTFTVDEDRNDVREQAKQEPEASGIWVLVMGVAALVVMILLRA